MIRVLAIAAALATGCLGQPTVPSWTAPRTGFGQPDLQGTWLNRSVTPLERPKELGGRAFLTDVEVTELKRRADRLFKHGHNDYAAGDNLFNAVLANPEHYKSPTATSTSEDMVDWEFDNRTSLIVDPPDGRIPPYTPEGQRRQAAAVAASLGKNLAASSKDLTPSQRCITFGVPRLGGTFSSGQYAYFQIFQSPSYVMLFFETIHDARIIPLDGRPHLPPNVRTWDGDSRGHWEGETLVVDTANFSPQSNFLGSAENLHLIERFTRIAPDEIRYELTIDDPTTWTKTWSAMIRLKRTEERLYEFACHEGNADTEAGILLGVRATEAAPDHK
ncbi:MAG TPA: hypothetical protein VF146_01395 [Bryobacteraceae bacterium]